MLRSEEFAAYTHNTFKLTDDLNLIAGLRYQQARSNFHESETANSIEFGIKGDFWDQRGRFAVAVYDQVYKDFQQDTQNIVVYGPATGATFDMVTTNLPRQLGITGTYRF